MSDFSLFSLFTAGLACFAPLAYAYTQPVGAEPEGNPITEPITGVIVPAGQPFEITWTPTTSGTVTLVLLKGPSTNAVPQYAIVENIPNSGSYSWTPSTKLAPSSDATGYGIQLICDDDGQYQYSTQFGISNADYSGSSASASAPAYGGSATPSGWSSSSSASASGYAPSGYIPSGYGTGAAHPTGWAPHNATTPKPTGHVKPHPTWHKTTSQAPVSSSPPTNSAPVAPQPTHGGAATIAGSFVGLVVAGGVAVFAL